MTAKIPVGYVAIEMREYKEMLETISRLETTLISLENLVINEHRKYIDRGYSDYIENKTLATMLGIELEDKADE